MSLSFRNRIAFHYMIATAIIMAVVFGTIYFVVQSTVLSHLDDDLFFEAEKHAKDIEIIGDSLCFTNKSEWEQREHHEIQVHPVFVQLIDKDGRVMDKSPNLKTDYLRFKESEFGRHFNEKLNNKSIRQAQVPIEQDGEIKGHILTAMSSELYESVILKLKHILLISYLIVLAGLYVISRFLAGRSIKPIQEITHTITRITKHNMKERVQLPQNRDELYHLSSNFNELLERIEKAIEREKQFTSDVSHELRTPLATLRGTLEVLIRKPRTQQEYENKIEYSLKEIKRMTTMLEQLLLLARLDTNSIVQKDILVSLPALIDESITHFKKNITRKNIKVDLTINQAEQALVPHFYSNLIINNILSNAIKYSTNNSTIEISVDVNEAGIVCSIKDEGIGIKEADLDHIYENFFRSDSMKYKHIPGHGMGLSIVKKCSEAIQAKVNISSTLNAGTTVTIVFLSKS